MSHGTHTRRTRHGSLRAYLDATGVSQTALARAVGVTTSAISNYALGKRIPEPPIAQKLSKLTGVPLEALLGLCEAA